MLGEVAARLRAIAAESGVPLVQDIPLARALSAPYGTAAFWCTYLALSMLAAMALHLAVEKPFLRWKDQIARRPRRQHAMADASGASA